jgi:hypothetical protein
VGLGANRVLTFMGLLFENRLYCQRNFFRSNDIE